MAATHRPDFTALARETDDVRRRNASRFRNEYLFPYINLEDLLKPTTYFYFSIPEGTTNRTFLPSSTHKRIV
jgi:hypothetical protein